MEEEWKLVLKKKKPKKPYIPLPMALSHPVDVRYLLGIALTDISHSVPYVYEYAQNVLRDMLKDHACLESDRIIYIGIKQCRVMVYSDYTDVYKPRFQKRFDFLPSEKGEIHLGDLVTKIKKICKPPNYTWHGGNWVSIWDKIKERNLKIIIKTYAENPAKNAEHLAKKEHNAEHPAKREEHATRLSGGRQSCHQ